MVKAKFYGLGLKVTKKGIKLYPVFCYCKIFLKVFHKFLKVVKFLNFD